MVSSVGLVNMHDMAAVWTRTRGSVLRILESVEDILKTLESNALRKSREDELNELEAQGIGEDLYIILREIAWRVFLGGIWKRDLHRMAGSKCGSHHLGLKGTNLGLSLCNQTMGSKSALMSLRTLPLQNILFNLSRQVFLARWHCLETTPSQIFALSYTLFHQTLLYPPREFICALQFFFWWSCCFFLSPSRLPPPPKRSFSLKRWLRRMIPRILLKELDKKSPRGIYFTLLAPKFK